MENKESNDNKNVAYSMENDPLFKPISEDKKRVIDKAVEKQIRSLTLDENVDTDTTKVPGQNYALISIVSPQGNQKSDNLCLKIRGVFNTLEEANKHAEMLQKIDSTFDVYVVEMYSWLLLPPDPSLIEQKHIDGKLNEIIGGHRESQLKSKMYFEERKRELIENINIENEMRKEENAKLKESEAITDITDTGGTGNSGNNDNSGNKSAVPSGLSAESSVNITDNIPDGNDCPNSGPNSEESTPSELMNEMINQIPIEKPSKSWADEMEK